MSEPPSIQTWWTVKGPSPCGPVISMPRIASEWALASPASAAILIPPALPRPPISTWALIAHGKPTRSAAATASSTVSATSPSGTETPCLAKSCLP